MVIIILHTLMISEIQPLMCIEKIGDFKNACVEDVLRKTINMQIYDTRKIQGVVSDLKSIKVASFSNKNGLTDFEKSTKVCRIVDMLLLPLYYIWEHCCNRDLEELKFEKHLNKPYQKFVKNPLTRTWQLYLLVSVKVTIENKLERKDLPKEIMEIYGHFLNRHKIS